MVRTRHFQYELNQENMEKANFRELKMVPVSRSVYETGARKSHPQRIMEELRGLLLAHVHPVALPEEGPRQVAAEPCDRHSCKYIFQFLDIFSKLYLIDFRPWHARCNSGCSTDANTHTHEHADVIYAQIDSQSSDGRRRLPPLLGATDGRVAQADRLDTVVGRTHCGASQKLRASLQLTDLRRHAPARALENPKP